MRVPIAYLSNKAQALREWIAVNSSVTSWPAFIVPRESVCERDRRVRRARGVGTAVARHF